MYYNKIKANKILHRRVFFKNMKLNRRPIGLKCMFRHLILLIAFITLVSGRPADHDFHVSRSEINYETSSGDIQIAVHVFIDDLESAIARSGTSGLKIYMPGENNNADEHIEKYLRSRLSVAVGNSGVKPIFIGRELSKDKMAVWCYLEVPGQKNVSAIRVNNSLLTELYNDQKNIVDFTVDNKKKQIVVLDSKTTEGIFKIK